MSNIYKYVQHLQIVQHSQIFLTFTFQMPSQNELTEESLRLESSRSCPENAFHRQPPPPFMTDDEARLWQKDRQKKDNHNISMCTTQFETKFDVDIWQKDRQRKDNHNISRLYCSSQEFV